MSASFSADALAPLLADKEVQDRLKPFLPAVENLPSTEKEIKETIQSSQFKQVRLIFFVVMLLHELYTIYVKQMNTARQQSRTISLF